MHAAPAQPGRQFRALLRAYSRGSRHRLASSFRASKLMVATLAGFLLLYLFAGYFLFAKGLAYVHRTPLVGGVLTERIIFLVFFFFFVMLVFSNAVIAYMSLFRSPETRWQISLPIPFRTLFLWKVIEALFVSSWGLVVLSAPFIAAYGTLHGADWEFYFKSIAVVIPFIAAPACLGAWLLLFLVYLYRRWMKWGVIIGLIAVFVISSGNTFEETEEDAADISAGIEQILGHTKITVNPWVPSTWASESIVYSLRNVGNRASFNFLVTLSYAMMGLLVTHVLGAHLFYPAWNISVQRAAASRKRRRQKNAVSLSRSRFTWGMQRSTYALVVKDIRTFVRDPGQWGQFLIVFALLFVYVFNLRRMGYDYASKERLAIIAYLNLTVCSLALSTLTTRFIFPQFSLEGRRLWILGLAPFGLDKVIRQKFFLSVSFTGLLTISLITVSGFKLHLDGGQIAFFAFAIAVMSFGLTAIAVGLGTLFPNPRESNPAKIVSGFGGTLCLIASFVYIVLSILVLTLPSIARLSPKPWISQGFAPWLSTGLLLGVTAAFSFCSLYLAIRKTKKLELLGIL